MRTVRVLVAVRPSVSVATQSMVSVAIWLVSMTMPLRIRRVLPQCGHRRGGLTVCGTRWACAREVAIRWTMAALYHALGPSRILEGLAAVRGLVEGRKGIGCGASPSPRKRGFSLRMRHLIFRNARLWKRFSVQSSWTGEWAISAEPL